MQILVCLRWASIGGVLRAFLMIWTWNNDVQARAEGYSAMEIMFTPQYHHLTLRVW